MLKNNTKALTSFLTRAHPKIQSSREIAIYVPFLPDVNGATIIDYLISFNQK